jgi:hypothetical protein
LYGCDRVSDDGLHSLATLNALIRVSPWRLGRRRRELDKSMLGLTGCLCSLWTSMVCCRGMRRGCCASAS